MNINQIISPKIVALIFGILIISFTAAFYVVAWQEPTQAPPGGNVAAPLNVSSVGQIKTGNLVVNALGISGVGVALFSMPAGAGAGKILTSDTSGIGTWQAAVAGIPSGMIAMFDTNCPSGWTRFAALDNRFPLGGASYGATGGATTHTHSYSGDTTTPFWISNYGWWGATYSEGCDNTSQYGGANPTCGTRHFHRYSGATGSGNSMPPYLTVVWCRKD